MREILYDIMNNSISGKVTLISAVLILLYIIFCMVLAIIAKKCHDEKKANKARKILFKDKKVRGFHNKVIMVLIRIALVSLVFFLFMDWRVEHQEYVYIHTPMASQQELSVLFEKQYEEEKEEEEVYQKLHISEMEPMTAITKEKIAERMEEFDIIYQAGTESPEREMEVSQELEEKLRAYRQDVNNMISQTLEDRYDELEKRNTLYKYYGLNLDLYHGGRVAADIIEKDHSELEDKELLRIASEAICKKESFLKYKDKNVDTKEKPNIKKVQDIAFENGKVYYQLYKETLKSGRREIEVYGKEFLVNAYVCMLQAEEEIDSEYADYYAKVNYYIGNCGQLLLSELSKEDPFYAEIGEEALEHYAEAYVCMSESPDFYKMEASMQKNTEEGMKTVAALLGVDLEVYMQLRNN